MTFAGLTGLSVAEKLNCTAELVLTAPSAGPPWNVISGFCVSVPIVTPTALMVLRTSRPVSLSVICDLTGSCWSVNVPALCALNDMEANRCPELLE